MTTVLLAAGDASGDLHAAAFVRALRERVDGLRFVGMGGCELEKAGVEIVVHQRDLAVGGLLELAGSAGRLVSAWRRMGAVLDRVHPALVVLVDSGGFNLPFARRARTRSSAPILYYIAPQVWAWRQGRLRKLAARADRLAVIFPFEPEIYARSGVEAEFVGHPLVEPLSRIAEQVDRSTARQQLGYSDKHPLVALLPGSRRNEIRQHLQIQLQAARLLHDGDSSIGFAIAVAPSIESADVEEAITTAALPDSMSISKVAGSTHTLLRAADVAILKPGTGTVEAALLECPMIVMGRANPLTALVLRRAVKVPFYAMPNLIVGAPVVPEFLQEEARPAVIADAVGTLFSGPARERQLEGLREVKRALGDGRSAKRTAEIAEEMLGAHPA